jgi:hypothetical protein
MEYFLKFRIFNGFFIYDKVLKHLAIQKTQVKKSSAFQTHCK